ncbi:hypothetical protein V6N13_042198 [Hibiscus sabdariffa]|uniref:Uncharacterized protein n=1 Tax=Hibiscus sabdariffa TaxID=183260 RepID=A0ABR2DHA0_9ROSI
MARLWEQGVRVVDGGATRTEDFCGGFLMLWAALVAVSLVTAILFSCAGGASKDKPSDTYGSTSLAAVSLITEIMFPCAPRAAAHPKPKPKPPVPVQVPTVPPAQLAAVDKH